MLERGGADKGYFFKNPCSYEFELEVVVETYAYVKCVYVYTPYTYMLDIYTLKRPRKNPVPISITQFIVLKYHFITKGNQSMLEKKIVWQEIQKKSLEYLIKTSYPRLLCNFIKS